MGPLKQVQTITICTPKLQRGSTIQTYPPPIYKSINHPTSNKGIHYKWAPLWAQAHRWTLLEQVQLWRQRCRDRCDSGLNAVDISRGAQHPSRVFESLKLLLGLVALPDSGLNVAMVGLNKKSRNRCLLYALVCPAKNRKMGGVPSTKRGIPCVSVFALTIAKGHGWPGIGCPASAQAGMAGSGPSR